jgi:hypothetical protein
MKDTTTKEIKYHISFFLTLSIFFISSCDGKSYNDINELIVEESGIKISKSKTDSLSEKKVDDIDIKKNKSGDFLVSWEVLSEYNTKNKKVGMNLKKIINKNISIKGFMIPLDYSAKSIKEFLLVPYMPSCAHVPPPPANMIINVKVNGKEGLKPSYYPVQISGKLEIVESSGKSNPYIPDGIYSMLTSSIKEVRR